MVWSSARSTVVRREANLTQHTDSIPFGPTLDDLSIVIPVQPVIEILVVRHSVLELYRFLPTTEAGLRLVLPPV